MTETETPVTGETKQRARATRRFADLFAKAQSMNHQVLVMVVGGTRPQPGDTFTYGELPGELIGPNLHAALDKIEEYLDSDEARTLGRLESDRQYLTERRMELINRLIRTDDQLDSVRDDIDAHIRGASSEPEPEEGVSQEDAEWMNAPMGPVGSANGDDLRLSNN